MKLTALPAAIARSCAWLIIFFAMPAIAQETRPPLVHAFTPIAPFLIESPSGEPTGFMVELSRELSVALREPITFNNVEDAAALLRGQIAGETTIAVGITRLSALNDSNVFSDLLAMSQSRLAVRRDDAGEFATSAFEGLRIGFVDAMIDADGRRFLEKNEAVEYSAVGEAVFALLRGKVDGLAVPEEMVFAVAHKSRLDHRISFVGPSIQNYGRVVALHKDRADLLDDVNAALSEMEVDGRLPALRQKYFLEIPLEQPEILTVGVFHFPPYQIVSNGRFTGFGVEALRQLAERAELSLRFKEITLDEWRAGPGPDRYDLLPQIGLSAARSARMDFSMPVENSSLSIFTRTEEIAEINGLDKLIGRVIGVRRGSWAEERMRQEPDISLSVLETDKALLDALLDGGIDAAIHPTLSFPQIADQHGVADEIGTVKPPVFFGSRAPALRFGLGDARERLTSATPDYLVSDEYHALYDRWFGEAVFWTKTIQRIAAGLGVASLLALLGLTIWYRRKARETKLLADVTNALPQQIMLIDPRGTIAVMNEGGLQSQADQNITNPVGRSYDSFIRDLVDRREVFIDGCEADETFSLLTNTAFEDASTIEYRTSLDAIMQRQAVRLSNGSFLLIRENVTEERTVQRLIAAQRGRLQAVMDATQSSIIGLSANGKIMFANDAARHMLGGISDEVPFDWPEAVRFLDSESLESLEASANPIQRALSGMPLKGETALMSRARDESEPRYARLTSARLEESKDTDITTIISIDDISELEKNRQQVERSGRLDALGQLTGGVAHDFNNILATIQYAVQLTDRRTDDERSKGYLATVQASIGRGAQLTQRLLAFAKRQPGLAASALADTVLDDFAGLAKPVIEETVALSFMPTTEDLWVFCDVAQLENALLNLVLNSRDAIMRAGNGTKIIVGARGVAEINEDATLRREDPASFIARGLSMEADQSGDHRAGSAYRYVEFSVTDNGPGMSDEVRRRAVDPFFTTKDTNSGTGLGLSMVYGFVQQAGGEMRIYSEEGIGTTVRLLIPRGTKSGPREQPVNRLPEPTGEQQRILIVEDEEALLEAMSEIVASLGYVVISAKDGREALSKIRDGVEIDLLLTDVVMPGGIGGFELAREIRAVMPDIPVLYMSGYAGFTEEQIGDVQAPLLQKPSPPAELAEAISAALVKRT